MLISVINLLTHISFLLGIGMIIIVVRKCPHSQIRTAFLILLSISSLWNLSTLLELDSRLAVDTVYMPFVNVCYISICFIPIAILYLGIVILRPDWQPRLRHAPLMVVPIISVIMVFTDPLHHQFFVNFSLYSSEAVYGTYYYFHSFYSYGVIAVGIVLMLVASTRNSGFFSRQSMFVMFGIIITVVSNMLYSFGFGHLPFSVSVASSTISILCFALAFLKYRFITALPISLRQVVDLISDGYLVVDNQLSILSHNQALLRIFSVGTSLGENLRPFIERNFPEISYDQFCKLQHQAIDQRETVSVETHILGDLYVSVEITPVLQHKTHIGSIILFKDITQSRLLIEATQSASRAKGDFLSHMSHEMRTPLNAIIGMINIGMNTTDTNKKDYCLARADSASKHLLGLINDVLDMSKIEAEKFDLLIGEFDFEKMLMNVTNVANVRVEEKQQVFVVNLSENAPEYIESDEMRLSQVITNLLTNAIKFTPEKGTVMLNIDVEESSTAEIEMRFEIVDNGIGISPEQQQRLFASFSQADSNITKKYGGTGLGLAISKRIVELMNGRIWVESELGHGSKFIFTIKAKRIKSRLKLSGSSRDINILAIDDAVEVRECFTRIMDSLHLSGSVAQSSAEALEMIQNAGEKPYNVFFIDRYTSDLNGIALAKRIKEMQSDSLVVMMVSASEWSFIEKDAVAAGVNHFITKPVFPSALIESINIRAATEPLLSSSDNRYYSRKRNHDFSEYRLLIAEDIEINREILSAVLEESEISIDYAVTGEEAVSMYRDNPDIYNLILMDINMPEMDGYEATRAIRALEFESAKAIPIIAMTANVFKEDIIKCIESGMNDHTGKPIDTEDLLGTLEKHLPQGCNQTKNSHNPEYEIEWNESILTGNTLIDMQHQKLFEHLDDLLKSCDGGNHEALQDMLNFLTDYTIRHCTDEEALQLACGYPDYERHRQQHDEFKTIAYDLIRQLHEGVSPEELSREIIDLMAGGIVQHIKDEDKKIGDYIRDMSGDT